MAMVKMPKVSTENVSAEEYIVAFFRALGWKKENLNPNRVLINRKQWKEICGQLQETDPDAGLLMMNYGPSGKDDVPFGKVKLQKGWITV